MEENELQCALKMSLAVEEEKKKLKALEDEELERAIKLSLLEQQKKEEKTPLIQMQPEQLKKEEKKEEKSKEEEKPKEIPKEIVKEKQLNPIDKVALKQKMLQKHDEEMKNLLQSKPLPVFNTKGNENLNRKLNEFEESKAKKLQEYREMILKMKKEERKKEEKEVDDILNAGTGAGGEKVSEEDKKRANMRKQLADKLKAKLNLKK